MGTAVQVESLWNGLRDNSGNVLAGGKVYAYQAGTTTDKALYTAADKSSSAAQPLVLDAYGRAQVWADGAYKFVVKTSSDVTLYTLDNLRYGYDDGELIWGGTSSGTGNALTLSVSGSITAYAAGQRYTFIANDSNTSSVTLNVNSIGAVSVVKGEGAVGLVQGDIRQGQIVDVVYDTGGGGRFRLISPISLYNYQANLPLYGGTSTGSANAQVITLSPAVVSYVAGMEVSFIPGFTNTGGFTLNAGAGAVTAFYKGYAMVGGEVVQNVPARFFHDGTRWNLREHGGGWATWSPSYSASGSMTFTSVTTNQALYRRDGRRFDWVLDATGTAGGTASNGIRFTPPVAPGHALGAFGFGSVVDSGAAKGGFLQGGTPFECRKYDNSNMALGTVQIQLSGFYYVA